MVGIGRWEVGFRIQHSLGASRWGGALRVKVGGEGRFWYLGLKQSKYCFRSSQKGCA